MSPFNREFTFLHQRNYYFDNFVLPEVHWCGISFSGADSMTTSTERLLSLGFQEWSFVPQAKVEIESHVDRDPQVRNDINAVLRRARSGQLDRAREPRAQRFWKDGESGGPGPDGDWKAPMASGNLLGELRFPTTDLGWALRMYVAACNHSQLVMVSFLLGDKFRNGVDDDTPNNTQQSDINEALSRLMKRDSEYAP